MALLDDDFDDYNLAKGVMDGHTGGET